MSAIQYFPPELIEYIISFLPDGAPSLIRPLSLVSRSWTIAAQNKLYGTVIICRKNQWRKLITRLKAFPHLRPVVRTIEVRWEVPSFKKLPKSKLRELFPSFKSICYHEGVQDLSLLLPLATVGVAQHSLRNLDLHWRAETQTCLKELCRSQRSWDTLVFRLYWTYWDDGPLELGTQLDVKSLTIVEPSSKTPLHIALLKGTTFSALHTLLLQFVTNGTYYHDASHGHGDNELLDDMGTDALVMDILSRVGAVTIELRTSAAINIILARCKAHLAVAYRRNVVKLHILEGQCQDYEAITM